MALGRTVQLQVTFEGDLCIVDPDRELLELGLELEPSLPVRVGTDWPAPLQLAWCRSQGVGLDNLAGVTHEALWEIHRTALADRRDRGGASLLALKVELARRELACCRLCAHECGVDRLAGVAGRCLLGSQAYYSQPFCHWAEEEPINPSLVVSLQGCSWRCRYCQQWELLRPDPARGTKLDAGFWDLDFPVEARSLSFVGGNPDESLPAILECLLAAPVDFRLPVVWNSNLYGTVRLYDLLEGVVDVYLPDLRYGNDECARRWSGAGHYLETSRAGLLKMASQPSKILVRLLVLPGHLECCHRPALEWLATHLRDRVQVSVRGQYYPVFRITDQDGHMSRRPCREEVEGVRALVARLGLSQVAPGTGGFTL